VLAHAGDEGLAIAVYGPGISKPTMRCRPSCARAAPANAAARAVRTALRRPIIQVPRMRPCYRGGISPSVNLFTWTVPERDMSDIRKNISG